MKKSLLLLSFIISTVSLSGQTCEAKFYRLPDTALTVYFGRHLVPNVNFNHYYEETWDFGDGSIKTYRNRPWRIQHTYAQSGRYQVQRTVTVKNPGGAILCQKNYRLSILAGGLIGSSCNIALNTADTIFGHDFQMKDGSPINTSNALAYQRVFMHFGGYSHRYSMSNTGAGRQHYGGDQFWSIALLAGENRACLSKQLVLASNDSILNECMDCEQVSVQSPYRLTVNDQLSVDPVTGQVTLMATGNSNLSPDPSLQGEFYWYFNTINNHYRGGNKQVAFPRPGTYYYQLRYGLTDKHDSLVANTTHWDSVTISVANTCQANFEYHPYGAGSTNQFYFNNRSSNLFARNTVSKFEWDFGDGDTSTSHYPRKSYSQSGSYYVRLVHNVFDSNGSTLLCSDTTGKWVNTTVNNTPCQASFNVIRPASGNFHLVINNNSTPSPADTNFRLSYLWHFGDGDTSTAAFPRHTYARSKAYNLCLTISATNKSTNQTCVNTFCDSIGVDSLGNILFKSEQGFSINIVNPATVSLQESTLIENWEIFPNPAQSELNFSGIDFTSGAATVCIFDLQSRPVKTVILKKSRSLSVEGLKRGLYLVQIRRGDTVAYKKILLN